MTAKLNPSRETRERAIDAAGNVADLTGAEVAEVVAAAVGYVHDGRRRPGYRKLEKRTAYRYAVEILLDALADRVAAEAKLAERITAGDVPLTIEAPRTITATIEALCAAGTILKLAAGHRYRIVAVIRCADLDRDCPVHARGGLCVGAIELRHVNRPGYSAWMPTVHVDAADELTADRCQHDQECPAADHPGHDTARAVAMHPEQGWTLLCNGVIVFDDGGELDPTGHATGEHRGPSRHCLPTAA